MTDETSGPGPDSAANPLLDEAITWCLRMNGEDADKYRDQFQDWLALGGVHREVYSQVSELHGFGETLRGRKIDRAATANAFNTRPEWLRHVGTSSMWRRSVMVGAASLLIAVMGWQHWQAQTPIVQQAGRQWEPYQSVVGEIRTLRLQDGSTLVLDTDSRVTTAFGARARRLRLERGRARFQVNPDARPFVVEVGETELTARGTTFDVSMTDDQTVDLTLLDGRVEVAPAFWTKAVLWRTGATLPTGTIARFIPGEPLASRPWRRSDAGLALWPKGLAAFDGTPLEEVVRQANRYARAKMVVQQPSLGKRLFFGTVRIDDTRKLSRILAHALSLRVIEDEDRILLLAK